MHSTAAIYSLSAMCASTAVSSNSCSSASESATLPSSCPGMSLPSSLLPFACRIGSRRLQGSSSQEQPIMRHASCLPQQASDAAPCQATKHGSQRWKQARGVKDTTSQDMQHARWCDLSIWH